MKSTVLKSIAVIVLASFHIHAQSLSDIEAVEYDSANNRYLISNGSNIIAQSAENGALSIFGQDPSAEFGMEVMNGVLYAITGGRVKGFDLTTGDEVMDAQLSGAGFLNGMASDGDSLLWVTDFQGRSIFQINVSDKQNPQVDEIVPTTSASPNGIYYDKAEHRLVYVNWGSNVQINTVDLSDNSIDTALTTNKGNCDGITRDRSGNWYIACWGPTSGVFKIAPDFSGPVTPMQGSFNNPADIDYNPVADVVAVPNSGNNTLTLIQLDNPVPINNSSFVVEALNQSIQKMVLDGILMIKVNNPNATTIYNLKGRSLPSSPLED